MDTPTSLITPIPVDSYDLAQRLGSLPQAQWPELLDQLGRQLDDEAAALRIFTAAEDHVLHDRAVDEARAELRRALGSAAAGVGEALAALDRLSADAWDVEYAESGADDVRAFLDDAARAIRAATALNPVTAPDQ